MYDVTVRRTPLVNSMADPLGMAMYGIFVSTIPAMIMALMVGLAFQPLSGGPLPPMASAIYMGLLLGGPLAAAILAVTGTYLSYLFKLFVGGRMLSRKGWRRYAAMVSAYALQPWQWHKGLYDNPTSVSS